MKAPVVERTCVRCIMDTSDPDITFDSDGVCNHCRSYEAAERCVPPLRIREQALQETVQKIRETGRNRPYDCVVGVSGGVDSSFAAYQAVKLGLRPLAVHLDNGWNTELATTNIKKLLDKLGIDLFTHVLDWEEFRDLQVSFFRASVVDVEMLTDHAITALLYRIAKRQGVRHIISGNNFRTETVMPTAWKHRKSDLRNIRAIHRLFGTMPLRTYPAASSMRIEVYKYVEGITPVNILNYLEYVKKDAIATLTGDLAWTDYGGKHYESLFTRFYQAHILPQKFGIDKRKAHFSALICSRQLSREAALSEIANPLYAPAMLEEHKNYVAKKLQVTRDFLESYLTSPAKSHYDYPTDEYVVSFLGRLRSIRNTVRSWRSRHTVALPLAPADGLERRC